VGQLFKGRFRYNLFKRRIDLKTAEIKLNRHATAGGARMT